MAHFKNVFFCLLNLWFLQSFSQVEQPNNPSLQALAYFLDVNNPKYENAEGSRYIFDDFKLATIKGYSSSHLIRLNVFDNVVELKKEAEAIKSLSNKKNYQIQFLDGSGTYETRSYITKDEKIAHSFFERIHATPNFVLFKKYRTTFEPSKPPKSSYEPETPAKFVKKESSFYFHDLQKKPEHLVEVPKKRKTFSALFGTKSKKIVAYIKKERLKINSKEDLIRILQYSYKQ